jgi:pimeloyl-ACP methyl ester carboxylesterase
MKKEKIKLTYDSLWKYIIRPPRYNYNENTLGPPSFLYRGKIYQRKDYNLLSSMGYIMKCSLIEPDISNRPKDSMPLVLYLHGNGSSRVEGIHMIEELLKRDINIFLFDFPGCGLSEGDYISLGYHEKDDVGIIIDFIETLPGVGNIGIWGRSMGASTALLYAHKDQRIKAICFDSPFADFRKLAKELAVNHFNYPNFLIDTILNFLMKKIKKKNGLDINLLKPIETAKETFQPGMFIHAENDKLIGVKHTLEIYEQYLGPKCVYILEKGGHNTKRPDNLIKKIGKFFLRYLDDNITDIKLEKKINLEENEEIEGDKENIKIIEEGKIIVEDTNENDKYLEKIEKSEIKHLDEMKSCLLKINPNDIKKEGEDS